ncbi:ARM repeat-containing protein [Punctularia strigosozonata HHB-11173 SS5]|uniref:Exportin-T n=1 Tax=Punctularia strigosozonata (strain HHB-11173) TaxID=741275 RepID=R7S3Q9_PUNST|nr:ARM repeat-containing protein [Punctularia strigosozonata HHB-11173 SS5]EIN04838.1 ARM repeat-containing protein [Punctularia strigosozonata HHB-11173 SS5]
MEEELNQVVQAILIASDPRAGSLHQEALGYLSSIQQNSSSTWRLALALYVDATPEGTRKYPTEVRFFALRVLDDFLDNRFEPLDAESFQTLRQAFLGYVQSEFAYGRAEAEAPFLRNKFSHTLTLLFLCTYVEQWPNFFDDLFALIRPSESSSQATLNHHVSILFFHIVLEISGEVFDQIVKAARAWSDVRHKRDVRIRDLVRERDAGKINDAVLAIVAENADRMVKLRGADDVGAGNPDLARAIEAVDLGIRTYTSYVGWIDINLTVTPSTIPLLFSLLSDPELTIRLATSAALLRIVTKGLKEPGDKLQLIKVLSLGEVVDALEGKTRAEQASRKASGSEDEGEESYREALGRLLNGLGLELMKLVDDCEDESVKAEATRLSNYILPVTLRFMADEYDDTSSTIFPFLQIVLGSYKRSRKVSTDPLDDARRSFLSSLLSVILEKLKWEETDNPEDMDEDDRSAFEGLRKDLRTFMDAILIIDQDLVTAAVRNLAISTLSAYQSGTHVKWNDAELAIYLVFIFGEINKTGGKGRSAFCQAPAVPKDQRKVADYSTYPLTSHGEMLMAMVNSGISSYPHTTVVMQFFETVARYGDFFKVRKECIMPTLQAMVDQRGLHNPDTSIRSRVYYLFHRFIRESRNEVSVDLALELLEGVRDLLEPKVDLPELDDPAEQDLLEEAIRNPGIFDSQLYLFETVGVFISLLYKNPAQQAASLLSIVQPWLDELGRSLQVAGSAQKDVMAILKVHHIDMALGNVAKGFPDYPSPPIPPEYIMPPINVFRDMAQAILVSLETLKGYKGIRDAARFAFARILGTTGPNITDLIPPLMANLLSHFEPSELVDFMNFIGLTLHKLQRDMFDVLDQLIGPLSAHIGELLSQPVTGTDDQLTHTDTKRAYLALLNNIMAAKLHGIFISQRNNSQLEPLLTSMEQLATDLSDTSSQKAVFTFFSRCVATWGQRTDAVANGSAQDAGQALPGFERFIYEQLVPVAFSILSQPQLNVKDGQVVVVLGEISNFLQTVMKTRGQEAFDYFVNVFLPAQNWPQPTALEFATKLRDQDQKSFRKYFTEFVRASRAPS